MASKHVKMVLSGDGGDELFAGYNTYAAMLRGMPAERAGWQRWLPGSRPPDDSLRARALAPPRAAALAQHALHYAYFNDEARAALYTEATAARVAARDHHDHYRRTFEAAGTEDCLSALQYLDLKTYLPGDILAKVDVASMYSSLEVRVPLLDHKVVEFAGRVPPELKLFAPDGALQQKYLLKKYANRILPGDAFARPKHGFGVPIDRWFKTDLYAQVRERVTAGDGLLGSLFRPDTLERLVSSPDAAFGNAPRIWALLCLNAWADVYGVRA